MNKKLKLGLLISGIGIATLGGGIGIGYAINHSINQPKYYNLEEQKIIKYRTDFLQKQYNRLVEDTNKYCQEYGGWRNEYDDVLKKRVVSPYENLDTNKQWYENWQPYTKLDIPFSFPNGTIYLENPCNQIIVSTTDMNGNTITNTYPINGYIDYIYEYSNCWKIYWHELWIFKWNSFYDKNDPETWNPLVAQCCSSESDPIIIYK